MIDRCQTSAVQLYDGATDSAELIGSFCTTKPSTQVSTGNTMRIRYFNDADSLPGNGFKANVSIGKEI